VDLEHSFLVTLLVTQCQFILIASQGLNMSSRSIITYSMYLSYSVMFWGYRKGSRANSNWEFIGITCIKCYLSWKICLRHNSAWEQDDSRSLSLSTAWQEARDLTTVHGRIPGVGLEEWRVVTQCLGGVPSHHCGLTMFGNLEVFFVSLSVLSFCFVIIIKYSRAQKGTQASPPIIIPLCCSRA